MACRGGSTSSCAAREPRARYAVNPPPGLTRREFLALAGAALAAPSLLAANASPARAFRVRAITAGVSLRNAGDFETLASAFDFLQKARRRLQEAGYEVQTVRVATQPLREYLPDWHARKAFEAIERLDRFAAERELAFSIGPVMTDNERAADFAAWAGEVASRCPHTSFTVHVASEEGGIHHETVRAAGQAMAAIAGVTPGGEGNFNFAATAFCPPGTPFFPAAWHRGEPAFALGLESPNLLAGAFEQAATPEAARAAATRGLVQAMAPLQSLAGELAGGSGRRYLGIDTSPAPGLDASIGAAIEALSGVPFGEPSTLAACAAVTGILQSLDLRTCGYSGLMLPVLEDRVLAKRAVEGRFGVADLMLYSSVCGTGLDVVPLPGDTEPEVLSGLVADVAALAARYRKPLSARLFPVPGRNAGDAVSFDNPYLTDAVVLAPA